MWSSTACPRCGGTQARREAKAFACAFCGSALRPRLAAGDRCADAKERGLCAAAAVSLCRSCAAPLCRRHGTRRPVYWGAPLDAARLFPAWNARDLADWTALCEPMQAFPIPDLVPFEWVDHLGRANYAIGRDEDEVREALRVTAAPYDAEVVDEAVWIESVCRGCESTLARDVDREVTAAAHRHARIAFIERVAAIRADLEQTVRYAEAVLGRPLSPRKVAGGFTGVGPKSPRSEWDACGQEARARIASADRLRRLMR